MYRDGLNNLSQLVRPRPRKDVVALRRRLCNDNKEKLQITFHHTVVVVAYQLNDFHNYINKVPARPTLNPFQTLSLKKKRIFR